MPGHGPGKHLDAEVVTVHGVSACLCYLQPVLQWGTEVWESYGTVHSAGLWRRQGSPRTLGDPSCPPKI